MSRNDSTLHLIERTARTANQRVDNVVSGIALGESWVNLKDQLLVVQGLLGTIEQTAQEVAVTLRDVVD